ncbi:MAG: hypothetical protein IBX53_14440, partial [Halomonas sp.]|nr:hypothetical protein [Halomonas sp.]
MKLKTLAASMALIFSGMTVQAHAMSLEDEMLSTDFSSASTMTHSSDTLLLAAADGGA